MGENKKIFSEKVLAGAALHLFISLGSLLPLKWIYSIGSVLGKLAYYVVPSRRKIALDNLKIAFPEFPLRIRDNIARDCFISMARSCLEVVHYSKRFPDLRNIPVEGREYLDRALNENKGVILLTAHLGNFSLICAALAQQGYKVNVITRPIKNKTIDVYAEYVKEKASVKTIASYPRKECVKQTVKALRNNELVMLLMDQNFGSGGVWVNFFGKLAATPTGPIVFALRTNAVLLPVYIIREGKSNHCIKFFSGVSLDYTGDTDETILINAVKLTGMIENWIKDYPALWTWIHRRWKSRPSKKIMCKKFKVQKLENKI